MKIISLVIAVAFQFFTLANNFAYSENGHRTVGAIADKLLEGKPTADAVKKLLGSITLERASTLPDELRGEDRQAGSLKLPENPQLQEELLAFRAANPPTPSGEEEDFTKMPPSHHWFHYTDVPIQLTKYAATRKGTFKWDIVQMIRYCARVLDGSEKPDNERKITPAVALVLMTHLVGDIHQPLHVGAIFMDKDAKILDPNVSNSALESRGGNSINFGGTNLHGYWDFDAVESCLTFFRRREGKAMEEFLPRDFAAKLVENEPANWKLEPSLKPDQWPEKWADEMLPIAWAAHEKLKFLPQEEFSRSREGKPMLRWTAIEKPHIGKDAYSVWASKTVETLLPKAGYRLAALVEASLVKEQQ